MADSQQLLDQAIFTIAQADGFLAKLYYYKANFLTAIDEMNNNPKHKLYFLKDPDLLKLRSKIEKKFPALPDYTKIPNVEIYFNQTNHIVTELSSHYQLFVEVYEFLLQIRNLIQEFRNKIYEFKMKKNRSMVLFWTDLILAYVRIYYFFSLIPEKSTILSLYCAAAHQKDPLKPVRNVNELKTLIEETANVLKHFFEVFQSQQVVVLEICYEFKDSINFASNSEIIRNMNLFNPLYETNQAMGQLAHKSLSPVNDSSAYLEMLYLQRYYDFVIVAFLICPQALFQEKNYILFQHVLDYRYTFTVYRDLTVNVHYELEKIQTTYETSPTVFAVTIAKGFKLKSQLKQLSRNSITNVPIKQRSRRLILRNDLQILNKFIQITPGLIGPKLPMILSASSMLKNELIAFVQHYPIVSNQPYLRKDTKAYYKKEEYAVMDDIGSCLFELSATIETVSHHVPLIRQYFLEYLLHYDLPILKQFLAPFTTYFPTLIKYYQTILQLFDEFQASTNETILNEIRQQYFLLIFHLSSSSLIPSIKTAGKFYETFISNLMNTIQHSYYYDSIELLIKNFIDPYLLYWYREQYLELFQKTITTTTLYFTALLASPNAKGAAKNKNGSSSGLNEISNITMTPNTFLSFFTPFESILNNIERDCLEEIPKIGANAVKLTNQFLSIISDQIIQILKQLWEYYHRLESQYHPIEAIRRFERLLDLKYLEALPGLESEEYAEKQIYKFILLQKNLLYFIKPFTFKKKIIVYNYEFVLVSFVKDLLTNFMKQRFLTIFLIETGVNNQPSSGGRSNSLTNNATTTASGGGVVILQRFSSSFLKFFYGIRILQSSFQLLDLNINNFVTSLLTLQCSEWNKIPPVGLFYDVSLVPLTPAIVNNALAVDGKPVALIQYFGKWFLSLVYSINNRNFTNYLLWLPSKNTFINVNKNRYRGGGGGGSDTNNGVKAQESLNPSNPNFAIELFLNPEDLVYLLKIIGINGFKVIESSLLQLITEQLIYIIRLIKIEYNNILQLQRDYCLSVNVLFNMMKSLQELFHALRLIGTALIIRQMLIDALSVVSQMTVNDLYDSLHLLHNSLNHWYDAPPTAAAAAAAQQNAHGNADNSTTDAGPSETLSSFYSLCHSLGIIDERDLPFTLILLKSLEQGLKGTNLVEKDLQLLQYLPIFASGLFIINEVNEIKPSTPSSFSSTSSTNPTDFFQISADFPTNLNYHYYYQIYANNVHLLPYTLNKLFLFIFTSFQLKKWTFGEGIEIQSIYDDLSHLTLYANNTPKKANNGGVTGAAGEGGLGGGGAGNGIGKNNIPLQITYLQSIYLSYIQKNYLQISSQILLLLSNQAISVANAAASSTSIFGTTSLTAASSASFTAGAGGSSAGNLGLIQLNYSNISFNSLYLLLFLFLEFSPSFILKNPGILERFFPYDILHNGFMEISLGKYSFHDHLQSLVTSSSSK